jgi:nucleotide-binding universal stress UspA family protein
LVAVEGKEDGNRIVRWLKDHPFMNPVELSIFSAVVPLRVSEPYMMAGLESWSTVARAYADDLVKSVATSLLGLGYQIRTSVGMGEAAPTIAAQAQGMDLIIASTHGRHGLERLLFGSISHAIVHRASEPVLIIH